jgi:phage shock protein A
VVDLTALIQLAGFVVAVAGAAVWLKSALVKQRHEELEQLAETRGQLVSDLKAQVVRQGREIDELRAQVRVIRELLDSNIAEEVAAKVRDEIRTWRP